MRARCRWQAGMQGNGATHSDSQTQGYGTYLRRGLPQVAITCDVAYLGLLLCLGHRSLALRLGLLLHHLLPLHGYQNLRTARPPRQQIYEGL